MPDAPLTACSFPRCARLARSGNGGLCTHHQGERTAYDRHRGSASTRGYDATWRRVRLGYLRSVGWRCEGCGYRAVKLHVHHIHPLADGGSRLERTNLEALCAACHNRKHGGERVQPSGETVRAVVGGVVVGTSGERAL